MSTLNLVSCKDKVKEVVEKPKVEKPKRTWPTTKDKEFYHEDGKDSIVKVKFSGGEGFSSSYIENGCRAVIGAAEYDIYSKPSFVPVEVDLFNNKACLIYRGKNSYGTELEGKKFVSLSKDGTLKDILN